MKISNKGRLVLRRVGKKLFRTGQLAEIQARRRFEDEGYFVFGGIGAPDFVIFKREDIPALSKLLKFREIKTGKGKMSGQQIDYLRQLRNLGFDAVEQREAL